MKTITTLTVILAISLLTPILAPTASAEPRKVNGIAAIANGRVVTINEVAFMLAPIRARLASKHPRMGDAYMAEVTESKGKILDELINRQLIIHEFNDMGAQIPDHAIKADIKRQIDRLYDGSEVKFREQLSKSNLSYSKFFKLTKDKLIGQAMRAQHFNDPTPATQDELMAEYNENKSDMRDRSKDQIDFEKIYIPLTNSKDLLATPETQKEFAEELIKKIKQGADFAELAKKHSTDAYADKGGKRTNVKRTDLRPDVSFALFTEPIGTVIGPIRLDSGGYQIIRVTRQIDGPAPSLARVKPQLEQAVQNRKSSVRFKRYLDRLRNKALIKYK
ncbi:MAG: peptidyl-prolyl cis-trans isomerase SurA [Rubritalea sp.]|jgi:peptidyl-prolyl cis-trans isomerase SurA|tara:strand:+ start:11604 stop:12605 length:1002 start_codon:yes stop_codon:yes gene_type:complete